MRAEAYLKPNRTSTMELFCENSLRLLTFNSKKLQSRCWNGFFGIGKEGLADSPAAGSDKVGNDAYV